eukprot:1160194-Pelagomonas_calceolata.AAC.4
MPIDEPPGRRWSTPPRTLRRCYIRMGQAKRVEQSPGEAIVDLIQKMLLPRYPTLNIIPTPRLFQ